MPHPQRGGRPRPPVGLRRPGESYNEVIQRLVALEGQAGPPFSTTP